MSDVETVADHPDDPGITPPDPIEHEDGSVEWPADPNFVPTEEDKDLTPVEADDDYSPEEYGEDVEEDETDG